MGAVLLLMSVGAAADRNASVSIEVGMLAATEKGPFAEDWLQGELKLFQEKHPEISVKMLGLLTPRRFDVPIEELATLPRNIVGICSDAGYEVAFLADRRLIRPIDDFLPDNDFSKESFHASLWEPVTYRGKVWGVPWATDTLVLVCDWPLFEAAGISEPPATWDAFVDCAQRLTRDTDGDGQVDQYGVNFGSYDLLGVLLMTRLLQEEVEPFSASGAPPDMAKSVACVAFFKEVLKSGCAKPLRAPQKPKERFAMQFLPPRALNLLEEKPRYRLTPLPTSGRKVNTSLGTFYLAIRRASPEEEDASWNLLKWMSRKDPTLPKGFGGIPCRKDVPERPDFADTYAGTLQNVEELWKANAHLCEMAPPNLWKRRDAVEAFWERVRLALIGELPPAEAIADGHARALEVLRPIEAPLAEPFALYR